MGTPKLSTVHEAVQRATLSRVHVPIDEAQVCAAKVHRDLAGRAKRILEHEGTNLNAYLGACVALLVEDYENATRSA